MYGANILLQNFVDEAQLFLSLSLFVSLSVATFLCLDRPSLSSK